MKTFGERLLHVLGERQPHPWGRALGLSKSLTQHVTKGGRVPKSGTVARIAQVERANLEWLINGTEPPFVVQRPHTLVHALADAIEGGADRALVLYDSRIIVLAIGTPVSTETAEDGSYSYVDWAVIDEHADRKHVTTLLFNLASGIRVKELTVSEMEALVSGQVGNWQLAGDFGGHNPAAWWQTATPVPDIERLESMQIFPALTYSPGESTSGTANEAQLLDLWGRIPAERQAFALASLQLIADTEKF